MTLVPTDLAKVRDDADSPFECAVCWNFTPHYRHHEKPAYEGLSQPTMILIRFCNRHTELSYEEMHGYADKWLDAQIEAGRARVGVAQIGGRAVKP